MKKLQKNPKSRAPGFLFFVSKCQKRGRVENPTYTKNPMSVLEIQGIVELVMKFFIYVILESQVLSYLHVSAKL